MDDVQKWSPMGNFNWRTIVSTTLTRCNACVSLGCGTLLNGHIAQWVTTELSVPLANTVTHWSSTVPLAFGMRRLLVMREKLTKRIPVSDGDDHEANPFATGESADTVERGSDDTLTGQPWFHAACSRQQILQMLGGKKPLGSFCVRNSSTQDGYVFWSRFIPETST